MQKNPKVTVLTPTFNRGSLLAETIESILGQTYSNIEYIVLDDGSTDDTASLAKSYGDKLKYVYQANRGEAATVNVGWSMASGDYFAMVSSDDLMQPNWIARCVEYMEANSDVIVVYPDWTIIDHHSRAVQDVVTFDYSVTDMISWFHCFPGPGSLIRRSALKQVPVLRNTSFKFCSDMLMWFQLAVHGEFARVPHNLATWRQHDESITVGARTLDRAKELVSMANEFFLTPGLPENILALRNMGRGRAFAVASAITRDDHPFWSYYFSCRSKALKTWDEAKIPPGIRQRDLITLREIFQRFQPKLNCKQVREVK